MRAHAGQVTEPTPPERPRIRRGQRRLLLVMVIGLGLTMVGGLSQALIAPDRLGRTIGLILCFGAMTLLVGLLALWRQWQVESSERMNRPRDT